MLVPIFGCSSYSQTKEECEKSDKQVWKVWTDCLQVLKSLDLLASGENCWQSHWDANLGSIGIAVWHCTLTVLDHLHGMLHALNGTLYYVCMWLYFKRIYQKQMQRVVFSLTSLLGSGRVTVCWGRKKLGADKTSSKRTGQGERCLVLHQIRHRVAV